MTYKVELVPLANGYSVACPDLPGCHSQGATEEEAIANVREAIQEYLAIEAVVETAPTVRYIDVPEVPMAQKLPLGRKPFVVTPIPMPLPPNGNYDKVEDVLDYFEGPYRR